MRISVEGRLDKFPLLKLETESGDDEVALASLVEQMAKVKREAYFEGWADFSGEICSNVTVDGRRSLVIPILLGDVEFVAPMKYPPSQDDRQRVRLVSRRMPELRRG